MKNRVAKWSLWGLLSALTMFGAAAKADSGWRFNFTPALVSIEGYNLGWGIDPELRYDFALGGPKLSLGARTGYYYAKDVHGLIAMPTVRLSAPLGALDTYVALGIGRGWIPEAGHADTATMYRAGVVYRFSEKLGLGLEGTYQDVFNSNFRFFSMGSMVTFGL